MPDVSPQDAEGALEAYAQDVRSGVARYLRAEDERPIPISLWLFLITATGSSIAWIMVGGDHRKPWHFLLWWAGLGALWMGISELIVTIGARLGSNRR
jgi:hypothetical protein